MTVYTLFCFFLSLQLNNSSAAVKLLNGTAGEDFSGTCGISFSGAMKVFCRENCETGNILIQTKEDTDKSDRYSIEYVQTFGSDLYVLSVKISNLRASDSGLYRCGLGDSWSSVSYQDFRLIVENDQITSTSRSTTRQSLSSTPGGFTISASPGTTDESVLSRENTTTSECRTGNCSSSKTSAEVWLFVFPTLTVIVLASVCLMGFCRKRLKKAQTASPCETGQTASETTRINDEDEQWRFADVEIYLAYINTKSSSATAAAFQHQAPDDNDAVVEVSSRS